jgi:peptidoglycan/LPS O-acetylase OafA/YrhL
VNIDPQKRAIPSLDGLRALSVLAVILGHSSSKWLDRIPFNASFRNGGQGVGVFFVISGFLITHLLLTELRRNGSIDLKRFYIRRTFRIFPPFYFYLLVIGILGFLQVVQINAHAMLAAATYTWNYIPLKPVWVLAHCWSLTLEEQFYLLWPTCIALFSRQTNVKIAGAILFLSPISRVVTYFSWPTMRFHMDMMLHTHLDTIMTGALLALAIDLKLWEKARRLALYPIAPVAALLFLTCVDTPANLRWRGTYLMTIGFSLENVAIAVILLYVVFRHESWIGKFLNLAPLRHFGMISYGIYLWQQLFTGEHTFLFPLNIVFIVACAELSYVLIERPSYRWRDRVLGWVASRQVASRAQLRTVPE